MNVVGLDLSLTATGIATPNGIDVIRVPLPPHATEWQRTRRLQSLSALIDRRVRLAVADVVLIEEFAFAKSDAYAHALGELAGVVKVCFYQRGIPFVMVPLASLKKYATGKGNANKDQMLAAAVRQCPEIEDNNAADAYFLRQMGLGHYEQHDFVLPEYRKQVLTAIVWPRLEEKGAAVAGVV